MNKGRESRNFPFQVSYYIQADQVNQMMEMKVITKTSKYGLAKKKSGNDVRLLIEWMFYPPLIVMHQIDENAIGVFGS